MPGGRTTRLTPKVQADIVGYVALGCTNRDAAVLAGVSERVFYKWVQRGKAEPDARHGQFVRALEAAQASYRETHLSIIRRAAQEGTVTITKEVVEEGLAGQAAHRWRKHVREVTAPPDVRASQWLLERKFPDEFGRPSRVHHEGSISGGATPLQVKLVFDDGDSEEVADGGETETDGG